MLYIFAAPAAYLQTDTVAVSIESNDAPCHDAQKPGTLQHGDLAGDRRRHAMPMHLPVRSNMAQESSLLGQRKVPPQRLRLRAQGIDDAPPVEAASHGYGDFAADQPEQLLDGRWQPIWRQECRIRLDVLMRDGKEAAARQG